MRIELQQLEQIDAYLAGAMNTETKSKFEHEINQSDDLKQLVENQLLMIQSIQRKALLAEINQFGSPSSGWWNFTKWFSVIIAVASIVSAGLYFISAENENSAQTQQAETDIPAEEKITKTSEENLLSATDLNALKDTECVLSKIVERVRIDKQATSQPEPMVVKPADASREKSASGDLDGLKTWIEPKSQYFEIAPEKGKTIECQDGTLIIVPENAFLDSKGNIVDENVTLQVVEALSIADMLAYNLTTMNNEKHLQSGGMIYVQPTVDGEKVSINPERPLHIQIPTGKVNPAMMAWKGEVDANGDINWIDPKPLEKFLTPVDFALLDFLPNGFSEEVEASLPFKNHRVNSKKLCDSLYYSLATPQAEIRNTSVISKTKQTKAKKEIKIKNNTYSFSGKVVGMDSTPVYKALIDVYQPESGQCYRTETDEQGEFAFYNMPFSEIEVEVLHLDWREKKKLGTFYLPINRTLNLQPAIKIDLKSPMVNLSKGNNSSDSLYSPNCTIDPLAVKRIKTIRFANTFLATKEFEERIKVLHQMPEAQSLLDLYVNNLNLNLYEADSLVASLLEGTNQLLFQDFAAQRLTNVQNNNNIHQKKLTEYYNSKRQEYERATGQIRYQYSMQSQDELTDKNNEFASLQRQYNSKGVSEEAISRSQPDVFRTIQPNPAVMNAYSTNWYEAGWMNIDAYRHLLEKGSVDVAVNTNNADGSAKIYQSINTLKTIVPLAVSGGKAIAKFPLEGTEESKEMKSTFCIGISKNGKEIRYAESLYNPYESGETSLSWNIMSEKELYSTLKSLPGANGKMEQYLKRQTKMVEQQLKIKARQDAIAAELKLIREQKMREDAFIQRLKDIAGSCGFEKTEKTEPAL